ncbi:hypothetical protein [Actinoallomurus sp. CA-150999]|uniref:hypothetical protein n=1 Tax=Actinoallomurus sp. CA-150999 TaxID=3239887 RepID=UPI003D948C59
MSDKAGDVPPKSPADGQAAPQHREAARHRAMAGLRRRLRFSDPGFVALRTALRAAIVLPIVFAVASRVIGDPQAALFASFGSFAMLVFADFSGSPARRFVAYSSLAATGAVLIFVGTLCSRNPTLAAAAMAVVGFIVLFAGVVNGYAAAGATAAILAFVLPVTIPAPLSAVPSRLEGWALAAGAGIAAQLLLWPARSRAILRTKAALACRALADLADAQVAGDAEAVVDRTRTAHEAVDELHRRFVGTPHRPTGPPASPVPPPHSPRSSTNSTSSCPSSGHPPDHRRSRCAARRTPRPCGRRRPRSGLPRTALTVRVPGDRTSARSRRPAPP